MRFRSIAAAAAALLLAAPIAAARAAEFVVGVHATLTGPMSRSGQAFDEGIQVAARHFNETSTGDRIRLITIDDESQPAKAVAAVEKLASEGAVAIIGAYGSNLVTPASDAAEKLGLVYLTAGAASEELTRRGYKGFFRINNNEGYLRGLLTLVEELKPQAVSVLYSTKESTSLLARQLEPALAQAGYKAVFHAFEPTISDFKPLVNRVKLQDRSDLVIMLGYENDYVGILRAAKVLKPNLKAIAGVWSLATPKMAQDFPDLTPNVIGSSVLPYPIVLAGEDGRRLSEIYREMYKHDVDYLSVFGFAEGMLLFRAIAKVAETGPVTFERLAAQLRTIDEDTLVGPVAFDASGENHKSR